MVGSNMRKMKDSDSVWIGEVPVSWDIVKIKHALVERKESNSPVKTSSILSLMNDRGVIPYEEKGDIGNKSKENLEDYKLAYPDDIVLNSMNVIIGSVGISKYFGAVSPVYYMLYKRYENDDIRFFNYVFQTEQFQKSLIGYGNGILAHRMRIQMLKLNAINIPYPNYSLQARISDYLDQNVILIDNIIEKTKQSIEEYKKLKQSIITEAVTKGLNPDVKMKDSGIEWIGMIPEHWEVGRMSRFGDAIIGLTYSPQNVSDYGIHVLRSSNVKDGKLELSDELFVNLDVKEQLILKADDILICSRNGSKALIGKCALIDESAVGKTFGAFMTVFRSEYNQFIYYVLNSNIFSFHLGTFLTSTINQLTTSNLNSIQIALPPMDEQKIIVEGLRIKCSKLDTLLSKKKELIEEMEAYKKSLIYEVVTGKKEIA